MGTTAKSPRPRVVRLFVAALTALAAAAALLLPTMQSSAAPNDAPFSKTVTVSRTQVVDGKDHETERHNVTLKVDRTVGLQDQQQLKVSWSGAVPTSNYSGDPNASNSDLAEHPMVLLQCRGTSSTITPETCWAPLGNERETTTGEASGPADIGTFPAWRLDRYASASDRKAFVGIPANPPQGCPVYGVFAERIVAFRAANGKTFYGSGQDTLCGAAPPEAAAFSNTGTVSSLPDNATFAITNADGTGSDKFSVRDVSTNASLGCSASVSCSMVAIPIIGISCDPSYDTDDPNASDPNNPDVSYAAGRPGRAAATCESDAKWPVGLGNRIDPAFTVSGQLWWSASNWRNRIVVPLTFAPVSNACSALDTSTDLPAFFGSEAALQATTQWSAKLCLTKGATSFDHVVSAEPLARTLVSTGAAQAALTSATATTPFTTPTVQAPVAATGFALSYIIDDVNGNPVQTLKLTPRLLAKLMTESYPDTDAVKQNYKALSGNPLNLTQDPEFQALNPTVPRYTSIFGTSSLFSISTPSDVVAALTSYINADPEARAWLDGKADPWGMTVNPNYKGISLPVNAWPLADSWTMPPSAFPGADATSGTCEGKFGVQPQPPYLQLISSPIESMLKIAQSIEYAQPGDGNNCNSIPGQPGTVEGSIFTAYTRAPRQFTGQRFVIGLTSLSDAAHYSLDTAALETSSSVDPTAQYTDATGRTFVKPTDEGLAAAFADLHHDSSTGAWNLDYATLRTSAPDAYPGAMLIYAEIRTKGMPLATGQKYAAVLRYMIGPGQVSGSSVGQLPDGYLSLTANSGLSALVTYTQEAANDVAEQNGLLPGQKPATSTPASTSSLPPNTSSSASTAPHTTSSRSAPAVVGQGGTGPSGSQQSFPVGRSSTGGPSPSSSSTGAPASSSKPTPSASGTSPLANAGNVGLKTPGESNSSYQKLLILLLILLAAGPIALLLAVGRRFAGPR